MCELSGLLFFIPEIVQESACFWVWYAYYVILSKWSSLLSYKRYNLGQLGTLVHDVDGD